ncbi:hypothetical protein NE237_027266 [Protea cynaroides]|uniref:Uncharacterized protein n=1 Tax=Protea cynaroides TaxID=273540 RepID=A0A9Q0JRR6_9MAGN|nr:hypothetical protein NE237_027266 [Protea cynaroides]
MVLGDAPHYPVLYIDDLILEVHFRSSDFDSVAPSLFPTDLFTNNQPLVLPRLRLRFDCLWPSPTLLLHSSFLRNPISTLPQLPVSSIQSQTQPQALFDIQPHSESESDMEPGKLAITGNNGYIVSREHIGGEKLMNLQFIALEEFIIVDLEDNQVENTDQIS